MVHGLVVRIHTEMTVSRPFGPSKRHQNVMMTFFSMILVFFEVCFWIFFEILSLMTSHVFLKPSVNTKILRGKANQRITRQLDAPYA